MMTVGDDTSPLDILEFMREIRTAQSLIPADRVAESGAHVKWAQPEHMIEGAGFVPALRMRLLKIGIGQIEGSRSEISARLQKSESN